MLAYAASQPQVAVRRSSPKTLLLVIGVHVAAVAILLSVKTDVRDRITHSPIVVNLIRETPPPPPHVAKPSQPRQTRQVESVRPQPLPHTAPISMAIPDATPTLPNIGDLLKPAIPQPPKIEPQPTPMTAPTIARLLTPTSELRPPYPESKLLAGDEAVLNLRLAIDEQGHVVAVDPVGRADRIFLDAARRYLIAHWRYKPATRDGHPVASSLTITLRFELD